VTGHRGVTHARPHVPHTHALIGRPAQHLALPCRTLPCHELTRFGCPTSVRSHGHDAPAPIAHTSTDLSCDPLRPPSQAPYSLEDSDRTPHISHPLHAPYAPAGEMPLPSYRTANRVPPILLVVEQGTLVLQTCPAPHTM
jgi:hypothetical protein